MVSAVAIACAVIAFITPAGAAFFKLLANNKACQRGVLKNTVKSLEECKGRCSALSTCSYFGWQDIPQRQCVHYYSTTCERKDLLGDNLQFKLFQKTAFTPTSRTDLLSALRAHSTSCDSPEPQVSSPEPKADSPEPEVEIMETTKEGDGKTFPKMGTKVKVHYTGMLTDGKKFDSSRDRDHGPHEFEVGKGSWEIKGWYEAVMKMSLGQRAILRIPSHLAYGERGLYLPGGIIPPNADLMFDIELMSVGSKESREYRKSRESSGSSETTKPSGPGYSRKSGQSSDEFPFDRK